MGEFLNALANPNLPFVRYAFIAGILSSVAFGVVGTYVVVRRISSIAGAIAHSVLAGIGASLYLQSRSGITWLTPLLGAVIAAVIAAVIIGMVSMYARQREDTVIGAIWAVGMATGLLLIAKTPGYVDPMSYLFGNILIISRTDLVLIGVLDVVVVLTGICFYTQLQAVSFDEEYSLVRGMRASFYYLLLLLITSVTVVLMASIVGIVMVIALLTLPAAVASLFSRRLWQMMLFSAFFTMVFTSAGLAFSYSRDLPSGSTIIVVAGCVYLLAIIVQYLVRRTRRRISRQGGAIASANRPNAGRGSGGGCAG